MPGWRPRRYCNCTQVALRACRGGLTHRGKDTTMAKTVGDRLIHRLLDWGVDTIFSLPGDGINGIFEAWRENKDKLRYIQVRHEEAAAFAACGYAKFTGRLGVCMATSAPGAIHLLNGLSDAKSD